LSSAEGISQTSGAAFGETELRIRIATRKSALALWQARHVADALKRLPRVSGVELVPLTTSGDRELYTSLSKIGGKGLFIKELEHAMQAGAADIAVHSMKDVPAEVPEGFCIAALLERADPFDALVAAGSDTIEDLPRGAVIGSSSLRRQAQIKALRPDLVVRALRGNVNTRLKWLDSGEYDAIILACAGLERLGLDERISERLSPDRMLPASAQGVIGLECRSDRDELRSMLARLDDPVTRQTTVAERAVARVLQASCHSPVASYARVRDGSIELTGLVASADGKTILRRHVRGSAQDAETLGSEVARQLLARGAAALLHEAEQ
jgi:hydroxymethylbilane synthase